MWQFAIDFDEIPAMPPPPLPDPSPEIVEAMRDMNIYANLNAIDLANDFEEYMGGKDKCSSDYMPRARPGRRGLSTSPRDDGRPPRCGGAPRLLRRHGRRHARCSAPEAAAPSQRPPR